MEGDRDLDVVTTDYGAAPTVFYNAGLGTFPAEATFNPRTFTFGVYARAALGDLSGDGRADVVVPSIGNQGDCIHQCADTGDARAYDE